MTHHDTRLVLCPACDGEGGHDKIGGFTASDMDEWYGGDAGARDEFVEDYRNGVYDEPCAICKGQRVVRAADLAAIEEQMIYDAECEAQYRAESPWSYYG